MSKNPDFQSFSNNNLYAVVQRCIGLLFLLLLCALASEPSFAKQHPLIGKIIQSSEACRPNYFFTPEQIKSNNYKKIFLEATQLLNNNSALKNRAFYSQSNFFVIPVNNCVLRGNRYYENNLNKLYKEYNVTQVINLDLLTDKTRIRKTPVGMDYKYYRMNSSQYPKAESLRSLITTLDYLSEARPDQRVMLTCFFGKHRTGLISAIYQFLGEYAISPNQACNQLTLEEDPVYTMMNNLAENGFFVYGMPAEFKEFYIDFTRSVCNKISYEFLEGEVNY